jgi:rubrerythrin
MPPATLRAPVTRGRFLRGATAAGGGIVVAGTVLGRAPERAESAASPEQDAKILDFILRIERLQAAFYAEAVERGKFKGELRELAEVLAAHEKAHVAFVEKALGGAGGKPARFDFGDATSRRARFLSEGRKLEDLGVRAYNAQAPNLSAAALRSAARIVSVEARHAAWIRDVAGDNPAPDAAEPSLSTDQVEQQLRATGFIR